MLPGEGVNKGYVAGFLKVCMRFMTQQSENTTNAWDSNQTGSDYFAEWTATYLSKSYRVHIKLDGNI